MDRVFALPNEASESICARYIPQALAVDPSLRLCKLYFGKIYTSETPRFVNTNNFPLDVGRFNLLRAMTMGTSGYHLLSWPGFDARDVELVMGSDGITSFVTFYVIDFNQVWFPSLGPPFPID